MKAITDRERLLISELRSRNLPVDAILQELVDFRLEVPSWGLMNTGTRFAVFEQPGIPTDLKERIDRLVELKHRTGIADRMATIFPWDYEGVSPREARQYAEDNGVSIGSVTPALFQNPDFMLGSLTHAVPRLRQKAVDEVLRTIEVCLQVRASALSLWLPDGSDYPGQVDFRDRKQRLLDSLRKIYASIDEQLILLLEYKLFEPGFYHTDLSDWGMSLAFCQQLGPRARVLVDLGHHAQGVNIEQIVAFLHDEDRLGGFHLNNRKYADDDLTVGAINPFEVFLIMSEIVTGWLGGARKDICFGIDQSSGIKPKMGALLQSIDAVHRSLAQALIVDRERLATHQRKGNVVAAEECLREAFWTDVGPLLQMARRKMGCKDTLLDSEMMADPRVRRD